MNQTHPGHLDYLDGWRGMAIALVLAGHFAHVPGVDAGPLGVTFFFVLSGWLMARLLFIIETPLPIFYQRRISRIIPAHLLFVAITLAGIVFAGGRVSVDEAIASALFFRNYVGDNIYLGHIWSLSVEEHSYIVLSLIALAARGGMIRPLAGVGLAAAICAAFTAAYTLKFDNNALRFNYGYHTEVASLGIMLSAALHLALRGRRISIRWATLAVPTLALLGSGIFWWSVPAGIQRLAGVAALALAVNLLPFAHPALKQIFSFKALRLLGTWSFSVYLWQQPFYIWASNGAMPAWLALVAAIGCGLVSFYFLERPARNYLNQCWHGAPRLARG